MFQDGSITAILSASCLHITRYHRVEQSSATQHVVSWTSVLPDEGRGARSVKSILNTPRDAPNGPSKLPPKRHLPHRMLKLTNQHAQYRTRKHERQGAQRYHWPQSVPSQQFQVLFNSLFKVLFIFPSRYLFAIGLAPIFSFRWNLPPN